MLLNPNEKIDTWDVVVTTIDNTPNIPNSIRSRKLTLNDLRIDQLPPDVTHTIDNWIEANYPVTWADED